MSRVRAGPNSAGHVGTTQMNDLRKQNIFLSQPTPVDQKEKFHFRFEFCVCVCVCQPTSIGSTLKICAVPDAQVVSEPPHDCHGLSVEATEWKKIKCSINGRLKVPVASLLQGRVCPSA